MLYGFVVLIDPWDTLPLSPPLPRVPISTNARYSFPALARNPRFDAVVLGTSTARLLQPALLDPAFGAHFANLAMNSATAYEQSRMLEVFRRAHPSPRAVIIGLDASWCGANPERTTPRPFPEWMYAANRWPAYREMLTPYAVQEAANQFAVMVHLHRRRYGLDGYTSFVPDESQYDRARRDAAFARWPATDRSPADPAAASAFPALPLLHQMLDSLPADTQKILFFTPYHQEQQGEPGSGTAWRWSECKRAAAAIAASTGSMAIDFMIPSRITGDRDNYWDPLHYRVGIAARLAEALAAGSSPDAAVLAR
ncbi:MAG: hypothetical protein NVSMB18_30950 [Acetobacteraceae bacterium]